MLDFGRYVFHLLVEKRSLDIIILFFHFYPEYYFSPNVRTGLLKNTGKTCLLLHFFIQYSTSGCGEWSVRTPFSIFLLFSTQLVRFFYIKGGEFLPSSKISDPDSQNNNFLYTFENFIIGDSNKLAYNVCKTISKTDYKEPNLYNPLFIYGSGQGKTHLLKAIKYEVEKQNSKCKVVYTDGDSFTNNVIYHLAAKNMDDCRTTYQNADFLLIDDIQYLSYREETQKILAEIFKNCYDQNKQIVISSDCPPKAIPGIIHQLLSWFTTGTIVDILPPNIETKIEIIKQKAYSLEINIPDEVVNFISNRNDLDIRQLECIVKRLKLDNQIMSKTITLSHVQKIINDLF